MTRRRFRLPLLFWILTLVFFLGSAAIFLDTYSWLPARTVSNSGDPRWRVFDYHSRQASEGEIYDVAEVPAVSAVRLAGPRTLRFEFSPPIKAASWTIVDPADGRVIARGPQPDLPFPAEPGDLKARLVPEGVALLKPIEVVVNFYPREKYAAAGLSWGDNYWLRSTSVPLTMKTPHSVDDWVGLKSDDPDLAEAKKIIDGAFDPAAPALLRAEQVFRLVMERTSKAGGTPTDAVQAATPLETCRLLFSGRGKGFCENKALIYYILANAAGVQTRLVDVAGKFGPLKLTGHYFCESWIPEEARWAYADPQSAIASGRDSRGRLLTTLDVKRAFVLGVFKDAALRVFDSASDSIVDGRGGEAAPGLEDYFLGYPVIAYKFGYGNSAGFSRIRNYLRFPTLLYADFPLSKLYLLKLTCLYGFAASLALALISSVIARFFRRRTS